GNSRTAIARRVGIDRRALAATRFLLGTLLLVDLLLRSRHLVTFYTDRGVLPRAVLRATRPTISTLSIHALWGSATAQAILFVLAGVAAVALALGYRTRLATLVSFVLLLSLHARNPIVLNGGDSLLRRVLLWGLFLPLGGRWSLDALWREEGDSDRNDTPDSDDVERNSLVSSVATTGLLLQVVLVYATNAVVKFRGTAWPSGRAVRLVFRLDRFTVLLGDSLVGATALLTAIDWLWLTLLVCSPLLLVVTGRARTTLAAAFAAGHLSMALTMRLGIFPFVSTTALLPFLHGGVWDRIERSGPVQWLSAAVDRWLLGRWTGRSFQPSLSRSLTHSIPVIRRIGSMLATVLLVFLVVWNAAALGFVQPPENTGVSPEEYRWDMFAPYPPGEVTWFLAPGTLTDGSRVDAYAMSDLDWTRPPDTTRTYPSVRWRLVSVHAGIGRTRPDSTTSRCTHSHRTCDRTEPDRPSGRDSSVTTVRGERIA
ncbi:MAG: HTTM domain-containing protein, partial [Halobaculum sp.]